MVADGVVHPFIVTKDNTMRQLTDTDLVGKTIKSISQPGCNMLQLTFSDDSVVELWAEQAVMTIAGPVPGIFIEDTLDPNRELVSSGCDENCGHEH